MTWLRTFVEARVPFEIGELAIHPLPRGWEIRGPAGGAGIYNDIPPAALGAHTRVDRRGRYRPLNGARTLPGGWRTRVSNDGELAEALETVYPLSTRHIAMAASGNLRPVELADVLRRQSGRYDSAAGLSEAGRERAVEILCGQCVRTPVWTARDEHGGPGNIPCPEACSVLVALCREAEIWERERPQASEVSPDAAFADFAVAGNEIREAYLGGNYS